MGRKLPVRKPLRRTTLPTGPVPGGWILVILTNFRKLANLSGLQVFCRDQTVAPRTDQPVPTVDTESGRPCPELGERSRASVIWANSCVACAQMSSQVPGPNGLPPRSGGTPGCRIRDVRFCYRRSDWGAERNELTSRSVSRIGGPAASGTRRNCVTPARGTDGAGTAIRPPHRSAASRPLASARARSARRTSSAETVFNS
jgi:hypothetical protein